MNWTIGALYAIDFVNLSEIQSLEILRMRNDESIRKWMLSEREISKEEHFSFIEGLKNNHSRANFAIIKNPFLLDSDLDSEFKNIDEFLGAISLNGIDLHNSHAWLGIYANPKYKNLGKHLLDALKNIAFARFGLRVIFAKVLATNAHAIKFYEKNGFVFGGKLEDFIKRDGKFHDALIFHLKNEDF